MKYRAHRKNRPARRRKGGKLYNARYRHLAGSACERCGFLPEDVCQLDVHHKDENFRNNAEGNLETLCANCHRLVDKAQRGSRMADQLSLTG